MSQTATMFSPSTPSMFPRARPDVPMIPMFSFSFGPAFTRGPRVEARPTAATPRSNSRRFKLSIKVGPPV